MDRFTTRLNNLQALIDNRFNGQRKDLIAALGVAKSEINNYFSGRNITDVKAIEYEKVLGLEPGYFDVVHGKLSQFQVVANDDIFMVPIHSPKFAAGSGNQIAVNDVIGYTPISKTEIVASGIRAENLISFRVTNDSMEDMIREASLIVVDTAQKEIIDNKQYAFLVDDDYLARVKTLRKSIDGLIVHSENPKYTDEKYHTTPTLNL